MTNDFTQHEIQIIQENQEVLALSGQSNACRYYKGNPNRCIERLEVKRFFFYSNSN